MTAELTIRVPDVFWMTATEGWDYSVVSSGSAALSSFYPYVIKDTEQVRGASPELPICRLRRVKTDDAAYVVTLIGFYDAYRTDKFRRPIYHLLYFVQPEPEWEEGGERQVDPRAFVLRYFETIEMTPEVLAAPGLTLESLKSRLASRVNVSFAVPTESGRALATSWLTEVEKKRPASPMSRGMDEQNSQRKFPLAVVATLAVTVLLLIKWFNGCLS